MRNANVLVNDINIVGLLFKQLRPKQWTKNILIFAALIFSFNKITEQNILNTLLGFLLFSFIAGCVYIINDFVDRHADSLHPVKKNRPIASGALNPYVALSFGTFLLIASLILSYFLNPLFMVLLITYFILNVFYSFKLKHIVILDVMIIATGFVLRAIAGGLIIEVPFTPWFLICTMFLSLFLAIGKRRHELRLLRDGKGTHRKVLEKYSLELIDHMNSIVTSATIISYSIFTFTSDHSLQLMWTIPFVIYGVFRYQYLIYVEEKGGSPENLLLEDKHILITVLLYAIAVINILIFFE
ncbi:decaprenyl-phosphate phosphoribosyltransferase [Bacillaceae bacterium CLA-AA-H227]|uniref:Decaprenyl-phosphate phosphoribosyltransferase n=1 Tax=Robertmurraya yapensis (ex Hitch et al 2024) TaxID=3133160 RepID=A0ACC6SBY9_9BACI